MLCNETGYQDLRNEYKITTSDMSGVNGKDLRAVHQKW